MTVGEILSLAAALSGKDELSRAFAEGDVDTCDDDVKKFYNAYSITVSELCEEVSPLISEQTLSSVNGKFYYTAFDKRVLEIVSARVNGKEVPFRQRLFYVEAEPGEVEFSYVYAPDEIADLSSDCALDDKVFSKRVVSKGVASEYLISVGAFEEAVFFRKAFEESVGKIVLKKKIKKLKKRAWV